MVNRCLPSETVQGAEPGTVDEYLDQVLPVMEADLFGEVAEAKEVDVFAAKYRQASLPALRPCTHNHPKLELLACVALAVGVLSC